MTSPLVSTSSPSSSPAVHPVILAIETSCDETAISYLRGYESISHVVHSQAAAHAEFGGVFPNLAKREHIHNIIPVLHMVIHEVYDFTSRADIETRTVTDMAGTTTEADTVADKNTSSVSLAPFPASHNPADHSVSHLTDHSTSQAADNTVPHHTTSHLTTEQTKQVLHILQREQGLGPALLAYINGFSPDEFTTLKQSIDRIAVTYGPGLEPALWVGISFAKALSVIFDVLLMPINHMEGHIASVIAPRGISESTSQDISQSPSAQPAIHDTIQFPALALLISGGHTELVHIPSWHTYELIGHTVDDAVGEAYDKTARILGLPYPGGPHISRLATIYRESGSAPADRFTLPRPMIQSKDFHFSFSGLKTAVLYAVRDRVKDRTPATLTEQESIALAGEFESAVIDVIVSKTKKALMAYGAKSLIIGGGVISNTEIRASFEKLADELGIALFLPPTELATDNATMIGLVAVLQYHGHIEGLLPNTPAFDAVSAQGNLQL